MLPNTTQRVSLQTDASVNEWIRQETEARIAKCRRAGPAAIDRRLQELDEEWDIERALEANAATVSLGGLLLGATIDKRWFALPALVSGFLLVHALQGWCPPLPVLRRLGFRTASEIDYERYALKALRGDFSNLHYRNTPASTALNAAES